MAYAADLCGSKLKAKLASALNEASAAPISSTSFAAKQMAKMGWKEGTGLGKNRDGIVSHIKVKKREENMGLGVEKERTRKMGTEGMWWSANVSDTLMRLQQNKNDKKSKKKKKDKKSKKKNKEIKMKVYTDEELFEATGGARFGMRSQRRAEGKWKRTEGSQHLKDWEEEVKSKIEWNGLGKAKLLLKSRDASKYNSQEDIIKKCKKRKRLSDDCFEEEKKQDDTFSLVQVESGDADDDHSSDLEDWADAKKDKKVKRRNSKKNKKASKKNKKSRK